MKHFYRNVPHLGHVALSRHAQTRAKEEHIRDEDVAKVLAQGTDVPDGPRVVFREHCGIRLAIVVPSESHGARVVTTVYRVHAPAKVKP